MAFPKKDDDNVFAPMILRKAVPDKERKVVVNAPIVNAGGNIMKKVYDKEDPNAEPELVLVKMDADFGKKMSTARVSKGLTQKQLGIAVSIPQGVISDYERGVGAKNQAYINKIKKYLSI